MPSASLASFNRALASASSTTNLKLSLKSGIENRDLEVQTPSTLIAENPSGLITKALPSSGSKETNNDRVFILFYILHFILPFR